MLNKKIKNFIVASMITTMTIGFSCSIDAKAANTVIPFKEVNGIKYVSLKDLTNATGGTIVDNSDVGIMNYTINGKLVRVNRNTPFISVSDKTLPYGTRELDGILIPDLKVQKVEGDDGEILCPVSIIEEYVGLKAEAEGFVVEDKSTEENQNNGENNGSNSSNNGNSSNSGNSSSGSNSNGGHSNQGGNSGNNGGGSKPSQPKPQPQPNPQPAPQPAPQEPNGISYDELNNVAESYGWTRNGNKFDFNGLSGRLGGLILTGGGVDIYAGGYSDAFEVCLRKTFNAIIPNGTDRVMSMITSGTGGTFKANNRTVTVNSGGTYIEIR